MSASYESAFDRPGGKKETNSMNDVCRTLGFIDSSDEIESAAIAIQRICKGWLARRHYRDHRIVFFVAVQTLQRVGRGGHIRRTMRITSGAQVIFRWLAKKKGGLRTYSEQTASSLSCVLENAAAHIIQRAARVLAAKCRSENRRKVILFVHASATAIQASWRRYVCRLQFADSLQGKKLQRHERKIAQFLEKYFASRSRRVPPGTSRVAMTAHPTSVVNDESSDSGDNDIEEEPLKPVVKTSKPFFPAKFSFLASSLTQVMKHAALEADKLDRDTIPPVGKLRSPPRRPRKKLQQPVIGGARRECVFQRLHFGGFSQ